MTEKILGKISSAEYGQLKAMPFLFGLQLTFSLNGGSQGVSDGGQYTINISDSCEWESEESKYLAIMELINHTDTILDAAKVNFVSELVGKPVEVELENNTFKSFRILTEVL